MRLKIVLNIETLHILKKSLLLSQIKIFTKTN